MPIYILVLFVTDRVKSSEIEDVVLFLSEAGKVATTGWAERVILCYRATLHNINGNILNIPKVRKAISYNETVMIMLLLSKNAPISNKFSVTN